MPAARFYSSTSGAMDLSASITSADTSITVSSTTGLPGTTPFALVLDPGTASEEIVDVTNVSGTTLTVTRGVDGSAPQAHSAGVGNVRHMATARDFREPQQHIGSSAGVHGVTGSVVGTSDSQTLTNKTLGATTFTGAISGGQAATLGAVTAQSVTASAPAVGSTPLSVALASDALGDPTGAGISVTRSRVSGAADFIKLTPGAANVFQYAVGGGSTGGVVIGKYGDASITQTPATGTAPALKITGKDTSNASLAIDVRDSAGTARMSVDNQGNIVSPTITGLDSRIGAVETNLGSQTTFAGTSAAKDGARIHWGATTVNTDGSGFATITHGAGFTPTVVVPILNRATGGLYMDMCVDSFTSTTFRIRLADAGGTIAASISGIPIAFFCGE